MPYTVVVPLTLRGLLLFIAVVSLAVTVIAMAEDWPIVEQKQQRAGGYSAIPDLTDERVRKAAYFAVNTLQQQSTTDTNRFPFQSELADAPDLRVTVARGSRQVVAGMNYKLVLVVSQPSATSNEKTVAEEVEDDTIVGGFGVTVYDHFGKLSVTKWGEELTKDQAKAMMENMHDFGVEDSDLGEVGL
jgi:hypothetical protein